MSDHWQRRLEAQWAVREYRRGNQGLFFKVVAELPGGFESTMAELIRTEEVAAHIADCHNHGLEKTLEKLWER